jgi:hypothetical protein
VERNVNLETPKLVQKMVRQELKLVSLIVLGDLAKLKLVVLIQTMVTNQKQEVPVQMIQDLMMTLADQGMF